MEEVINKTVSIIAVLCNLSHPGFTRESKEDCLTFMANCVIETGGKVSEDQEKLNACVRTGQEFLKRKKLYDDL